MHLPHSRTLPTLPYLPPSDELRQKLAMQRAFVPWGSKGGAFQLPKLPPPPQDTSEEALPPGIEPLQLWPLEDSADVPANAKPIMVDNMLAKWLRPHQREGCEWAQLVRSVRQS